MNLSDLLYVVEYIKDRLYFATVPKAVTPRNNSRFYFFSVENELVYEGFNFDFGPLNLSMLYRYCMKVSKLLSTYNDKVIVHYTSMVDEKRANAAFLIASFAIIHLKKTVQEVLRPLIAKDMRPIILFRDAAMFSAIHSITLQDCLEAIHRALALGFFRFDDFNLAEYEHYERVEGGDVNWIVPQKFLAFSGPHSGVNIAKSEHPPEFYFSYFKKNHVTNVIRLNQKCYDASRFTDSGIQHSDLFFVDGGTPSDFLLERFFKITENAKGAIAVHCKAGLGRTGSLIACYLIKHYRFDVCQAIAWVRICRPGSVIGGQQMWLQKKKTELWAEGAKYRLKAYGNSDFIPTHKFGIYSNKINTTPNGSSKNWQADPLYEPKFGGVDGMTKITNEIKGIKLQDKEEPAYRTRACTRELNWAKKTGVVELNPNIGQSRGRMTQGDYLVQIKASRKQNRSTATPITPLAIAKSRLIAQKVKPHMQVTKVCRVPADLSSRSGLRIMTCYPNTVNGVEKSGICLRSRRRKENCNQRA